MPMFVVAFNKGAGGLSGVNAAIQDCVLPALKEEGRIFSGETCSNFDPDADDKLLFKGPCDDGWLGDILERKLPAGSTITKRPVARKSTGDVFGVKGDEFVVNLA